MSFIVEFIIEEIFINFIGGLFVRLNNRILSLRGIENKSADEVKLKKLRNRYEYKNVISKINLNEVMKGEKGVVVELINHKFAYVEFKKHSKITKIQIKDITLTKK